MPTASAINLNSKGLDAFDTKLYTADYLTEETKNANANPAVKHTLVTDSTTGDSASGLDTVDANRQIFHDTGVETRNTVVKQEVIEHKHMLYPKRSGTNAEPTRDRYMTEVENKHIPAKAMVDFVTNYQSDSTIEPHALKNSGQNQPNMGGQQLKQARKRLRKMFSCCYEGRLIKLDETSVHDLKLLCGKQALDGGFGKCT